MVQKTGDTYNAPGQNSFYNYIHHKEIYLEYPFLPIKTIAYKRTGRTVGCRYQKYPAPIFIFMLLEQYGKIHTSIYR